MALYARLIAALRQRKVALAALEAAERELGAAADAVYAAKHTGVPL